MKKVLLVCLVGLCSLLAGEKSKTGCGVEESKKSKQKSSVRKKLIDMRSAS
ncbi:MAG: hypothetical protein JXQ67_00770 [Campylobacterales bacterium]|nr:hypothetical protein [Campylobacterales bacterium]